MSLDKKRGSRFAAAKISEKKTNMDDELEDKVLYQTCLSHMKLLSKYAVGLPLNPAPLSYLWRIARIYFLRSEVFVIGLVLFVVYLYIQTLDGWSRGIFSKLHLSLEKPKSLRFLGAGGLSGDKLSWELKENMVAAYAVQGRRPKMEDRFVIHEDLNHTGISVFAVFDGHGGEVRTQRRYIGHESNLAMIHLFTLLIQKFTSGNFSDPELARLNATDPT